MKRGEIWTVAGAADYAGKPRPSVILQDEDFETSEAITICGLTSDLTMSNLLRIAVKPTPENGLQVESSVMIDKVTTIARSKLGRRIGRLEEAEMVAISRAIIIFLGLAKTRES